MINSLSVVGLALATGYAVEEWLEISDWGCCFIIAALGIRYDRMVLFKLALDNLNEGEETHYREIVDACLWHNGDINPYLNELRQHPSPVAQQAYIAVLRTNREGTDSQYVNQFFLTKHLCVKTQLLNWIGEQNHQQYIGYVQQNYIDPETPEEYTLSFAAIRAGILLKDPVAQAQLKELAFTANPVTQDALSLLLIKETYREQIVFWLDSLWASKDISLRAKIHGTAVSGLVSYMENIFECMPEQDVSRVAGDAFALITGVDIEASHLDDTLIEAEVESFDPTTNDYSQQSSEGLLAAAWEEDLALPDTDACYFWWQENQDRFSQDTRYLAGLEITEDKLQQVMKDGNQRQRQLASIHLSLHHGYQWKDPNWP